MQNVMLFFIPGGALGRDVEATAALGRIGAQMFKASDTIPGGTAGAIRNELLTKQPTQGRFHLEKGAILIRTINNWLKVHGAHATAADIKQAEEWLKDLKDAFGTRDPDSFIGKNNVSIVVVPELVDPDTGLPLSGATDAGAQNEQYAEQFDHK